MLRASRQAKQIDACLAPVRLCWAEAPIKIARMTLTIKLDRNWSSFQLANSAPPLSVTDSAIAPSARMPTRGCAGDTRLMSVQAKLFDSRFCSEVMRPIEAVNACYCSPSHCHSQCLLYPFVGTRRSLKNCISHIDASHSRQPLVKGERLVRYEVNAVMVRKAALAALRFLNNTPNFSQMPFHCGSCAGICPATVTFARLQLAVSLCTVAILAQGTSRAVAVTQALFIFVCIYMLG